MSNNLKQLKAFTLIELLVVVAIIGIISSLLMVSIEGVQERARDSRIKNEMNQLGKAVEIYGLIKQDYTSLSSDQEISTLLSSITSQGGTAESNIFISGDGNNYCIFSSLNSNQSWCIDNTGYSGTGSCTSYQCDYFSQGGYLAGSLADGLVGYWTMDQTHSSGSTLFDQSSYGNDGTIYGATFATDRMGQPNKAMSFNGVDDYIDCGNNSSLNITDEITISAWVKTSDTHGVILIKENGGSWGNLKYSLWIRGGKFQTSINSSSYPSWLDSNTKPNGSWQHVLWSFDKKISDNNWKIYINGELKNSSQHISSISTGGGIYLGLWYHDFNYAPFNGLIDDVRIYNRALSASEIQQLYQLGN